MGGIMDIPKNPIGLKLILASLLTLFIITATSKSMADDVTASSCSASDIQSAINFCASGGGGIVTIPECDFEKSCEKGSCWSASDDISYTGSAKLIVRGQGENQTRISYLNDQQRTGGSMFSFTGTGFKEFGYIYLEGNDNNSTYRISSALEIRNAANARVHHVTTKYFYSRNKICSTSDLLIDHCTFNQVLDANQYHFSVYDTADVPWSDDFPADFGTLNFNVFFEDNTLIGSHHPVSLFERAKVVFRYNTVIIGDVPYTGDNQGNLDVHSPHYGSCPGDGIPDASSYEHGGMAFEIYNNTFQRIDSAIDRGYAIRIRSGAAIITENTFTDFRHAISLVLEGHNIGANCNAANNYPQDHDFPPGIDTCSFGTQGCCDKVEFIYIWDNSYVSNYNNLLIEGNGIEENDEYYLRAPNINEDGLSWVPYTYPHPMVYEYWPPDPPENLRYKK
jgi:hypothetical protein